MQQYIQNNESQRGYDVMVLMTRAPRHLQGDVLHCRPATFRCDFPRETCALQLDDRLPGLRQRQRNRLRDVWELRAGEASCYLSRCALLFMFAHDHATEAWTQHQGHSTPQADVQRGLKTLGRTSMYCWSRFKATKALMYPVMDIGSIRIGSRKRLNSARAGNATDARS